MLAGLPSAALPARADEPPTLLEVAAGYGFSASDVETMRSGKLVFGSLEAVSENELALSAALLSRRPVDWHFRHSRDPETAANLVDPTQTAIHVLDGDGHAGLSQLVLDAELIDQLAQVEAGWDANFSGDEIRKLREAGRASDPAARRAAVLEAFREVLSGRYRAYRERGLKGLVPYDRGGAKKSSPGPQLERAFQELRLTRRVAPTVHAAMASFPSDPPEGTYDYFVCLANAAEGKTLISLAHVLHGIHNDRFVEIVRRYYIHRTLNSMQTTSVTMPVEEGTAILYANRTSTDLVTGFGSSIAKRVGSFLMRREIGRLANAYYSFTETSDAWTQLPDEIR